MSLAHALRETIDVLVIMLLTAAIPSIGDYETPPEWVLWAVYFMPLMTFLIAHHGHHRGYADGRLDGVAVGRRYAQATMAAVQDFTPLRADGLAVKDNRPPPTPIPSAGAPRDRRFM